VVAVSLFRAQGYLKQTQMMCTWLKYQSLQSTIHKKGITKCQHQYLQADRLL
jgi:hypothetical protein